MDKNKKNELIRIAIAVVSSIVVLALWFLVIQPKLFPQPPIIQGTVMNEDGEPIEGATVTVSDNSGNERMSTVDEKGQYLITDISSGVCIITVKAEGYDFKRTKKEVENNKKYNDPEDERINFVLEKLEQKSSSDEQSSDEGAVGDSNELSGEGSECGYVLCPVDPAKEDEFVEYDTDKFKIIFNKKGGIIEDIRYKDFPNENAKYGYESAFYDESIDDFPPHKIDPKDKYRDSDREIERPFRGLEVKFASSKGNSSNYQSTDTLYSQPYSNYKYEINDNEVIFRALFKDEKENPSIVEIIKKYVFKKDQYDFDLELSFINKSNEEVVVSNDNDNEINFSLLWGGGIGPYSKRSNYDKWTPYITTKDGKILYSIDGFKKSNWTGNIIRDSRISWIGGGNRYFLVSMMPDKEINEDIELESAIYNTSKEKNQKQTGFFGLGYEFGLKEGVSKKVSVTMYVGPKKHEVLSKFDNKMEKTAERGIWFLVSFVQWLLLGINSFVNNFGVSIILVTIILRLVLLPLQAKSMSSMARMKDLQPKLNELKEKYKDKPELLNKATMELYKKEKINPLGGCLPMLIQMPFFIAFFQTMPYLVQLKGESFLWIKDLASPDTLATLPFWPGEFNLLPLIMVAVMAGQTILQQKLQPSTPGAAASGGASANQMKIFMFALPIVFLVITYTAPSGLTIYWTFSTLIGIATQALFNFLRDRKKKKNPEQFELYNSKGKKIKKKK